MITRELRRSDDAYPDRAAVRPPAPDFYTTDPFGVYRSLRDEAPAFRNEQWGWWVLTRFDDVRAAIQDSDTFRSFEGMDIDDSALEQAPPGSSPSRQPAPRRRPAQY